MLTMNWRQWMFIFVFTQRKQNIHFFPNSIRHSLRQNAFLNSKYKAYVNKILKILISISAFKNSGRIRYQCLKNHQIYEGQRNVLPNNVITLCLKSQKKLQKETGFVQTIKYFMSGLSMVHKLTIALMISTFHKSIYAYILVKLENQRMEYCLMPVIKL